MFSPLAWQRALLLLIALFASLSNAREESLFTSSVTYCDPPETLLVQQFDIAYFAQNRSVSFNISAASVQANVNVTANLFLNVYGMNPVNITIDLCSILSGALCPLPMYNFTGADSIPLPSSINIADRVPGIAFKIPDLEGFAQLTLTEASTGNIKACVQATLSNGWSTNQPAVKWTTAGVAIAALVSALLHSLRPESIVPFRFLDLIYLFQTIASSSFLSLNYPSVYRSFTLNFAWAMGLLSSSATQNSIDHMRHLTGGTLADSSSGSAIGFVNRKLSPYNAPGPNFAVSLPSIISRAAMTSADAVGALLDLNFPSPVRLPNIARRSGTTDVQTVTAGSSNVLQAGLPIYVNSVHIATANAFMTVFFFVLIMFVVAAAVFGLGYIIIFALRRARAQRQKSSLKFDYLSFSRAWVLRLGLIASFPLLVFIFYQWTLKDSWLSILLSVLTLIAIACLILHPTYSIVRLARRSPSDLHSHTEPHLASHGPLYAQYRVQRYFFFLPLMVAMVLKSMLIAFAHANGKVQVILMVVVEGALVGSHFVLRPYKSKGGDVFSTFIAIMRLACTGLMIAFLESLNVKAIPRVVIGIIISILFSVTIIVVIINLVLHSGLYFIFRRKRAAESSSSTLDSPHSESSMLEKASKGELTHSNSWDYATGRPVNPTPEHSIPMGPEILHPFPISPTTTVSTAEPPSLYSRDSATITVGSLLPSRWSFSMSQPATPAASSTSHSSSSHQHSVMTTALQSPMFSVEESSEEPEHSRQSLSQQQQQPFQ